VRAFLTWCARNGVEPALDRPTVDKFVAALLDDGAEPATARFRQLARPGRPRTLAGIKDFHPHVMRHTAADRWLSAGGSEGGLMAIAGWTRPDMLLRYTGARAAQRAADEARGLNLGDL